MGLIHEAWALLGYDQGQNENNAQVNIHKHEIWLCEGTQNQCIQEQQEKKK